MAFPGFAKAGVTSMYPFMHNVSVVRPTHVHDVSCEQAIHTFALRHSVKRTLKSSNFVMMTFLRDVEVGQIA